MEIKAALEKVCDKCDKFATTLRQLQNNKKPINSLIYIYIYIEVVAVCSLWCVPILLGSFWALWVNLSLSPYIATTFYATTATTSPKGGSLK
jgi:hypothetical protein